MFGGCNIEVYPVMYEPGETALNKALTEGYTNFLAVCFWQEKIMPLPGGRTLQLLSQFNDTIQVIVATDNDFQLHHLYELFPYRPTPPEVD